MSKKKELKEIDENLNQSNKKRKESEIQFPKKSLKKQMLVDTNQILDYLNRANIDELFRAISQDERKQQIIQKLSGLNQKITLSELLELDYKEIISKIEEGFIINNQDYNDSMQPNHVENHKLTQDLGHKMFLNENQIFEIQAQEQVFKDESYKGELSMKCGESFNFKMQYSSKHNIKVQIEEGQAYEILKLMGLDQIEDEKKIKNLTNGLVKVLKDYILKLLPICENNDLYDDESDQCDSYDEEDDPEDDEI